MSDAGPPPFKILIPARYGATRLPGKPLRELAGRALVLRVLDRARESGAQEVVVATDDERIRAAVELDGARAYLTGTQHACGSDRLAEAVTRLGWGDEELVVNLQGDEPLMPAELVHAVVADLAARPEAQVATLAVALAGRSELLDPHVVKVVTDRDGYASYFSRAPIPWARDAGVGGCDTLPEGEGAYLRHLGLYAYRVGSLKWMAGLDPAPAERLESLEQLRVLWHGGRIHVAVAAHAPPGGVDTEADLQRVAARFAAGP